MNAWVEPIFEFLYKTEMRDFVLSIEIRGNSVL
ncbi:hypothetical protein DET54_11270 [Paenibacillus pabuli]|uniref:Uncharacterized protein n=1 Tax=Paenibacillus pabuli TaxID=1472 RepID=A0ABX9BFW0_9BACL|nr:hypothetical protein DET54_11270 [Paenibacillus pabuli]